MKNRKYKVGDVVLVKGERELFEVVEIYFESTDNKYKGKEECCYLTIEGMKTGKNMDMLPENDTEIEPIATSKIGEPYDKNLDVLLDQYNHSLEMHNILNSTGVKDDEYEYKANKIMDLIVKMFGYSVMMYLCVQTTTLWRYLL